MIKNIDRTWVRFYKELAERLLDYKSNRENLIAKIKKVYELTEMKLIKPFIKCKQLRNYC